MKTPGKARVKSHAFKIAVFFALAVIAIASGVLAAGFYAYWQGQAVYDGIAEVAFFASRDGGEEALEPSVDEGGYLDLTNVSIDWASLAQINPDVVGWVQMPGTPIDYPVAHSHDNDEYLYKNFTGEYANGLQPTYGTPFLMAQNSVGFEDAVNIIQAHNMSNGSMFAAIPKLLDADAFNENRTVYVFTPRRNYRCETVAVVTCGANDELVRTDFAERADFASYMEGAVSRSAVAPDFLTLEPSEVGKAFVLSTCTDGGGQRCLLVCAVVDWADVGERDAS